VTILGLDVLIVGKDKLNSVSGIKWAKNAKNISILGFWGL